MGVSGWSEVRGRVAVLAVAGALVTALLLVIGPGSSPDRSDPAGPLVLSAQGDGVAALDVPLGPDRLTEAGRFRSRTDRIETTTFSMVGLTWQGDAVPVRFRVRSDGSWEPWQDAEILTDRPDRGTAEAESALTGTDLAWVGPADAVQVEVRGPRPDGLTLALLHPETTPVLAPRRSARGAAPGQDPSARASGRAVKKKANRRPRLLNRGDWGADGSMRNGRPTYLSQIRQVHVHHTVSSNDYDREDVAGMIRGMYRYHTQNLGWSDIGYNFLVDRFGRIWVGRAGGPRKAVQGAHTLGFNNTSTGVSAIGNFETAQPTSKMIGAIARVTAWKLDQYDRTPRGRIRVTSTGSDRFPAGQTVRLPKVDGHRDTNQTACPGINLYEKIRQVRRRAARRQARF